MLKKFHIALLPLIVGMVSGCGSGSSSETATLPSANPPLESGTVEMVTGEYYSVLHGDKIVKITPSATIDVIHSESENKTVVKLIDGKAEIIYNH